MSYLNQKLQRAMRGGDVGGMQEVASQASKYGSRDIMRQAERGLREYTKAQEKAQRELVAAQRDAQRQADRQARESASAAKKQASQYDRDAIAFWTDDNGVIKPYTAPSGGVFKKWGKSGVLWDSITGLPYAMDAKSRAVTQIDPDKDGKLVSKDGHMYKVVEGLPWKHVGFDPAKVGNDPALAKELAAKTADAKREADQASDKAAATRKLISDNEKAIRALEKDQLNANSDDHKRIQGEIDQLKGKNKGLRERIELEQIDAHKKAAYRQEVESANDKRLADDLASRQARAYQGDPKGGLGLQSALDRISQAQQSASSYNTDPVAALMGSIADRGLAAAGRLESDNLKIADSITNAWNSNQKARTDAKIDAWGRNKSIEQTNALLAKMDASGTYKLTGTNEKGKATGLLHDPDASPELKARIQNFVNKTGVTEIPRSWMTPEAQEARANANQFGLYDVKLPQNFVLSKGAISTTRDEQSNLWGIPMPWNTKGKPVDVGTYQFDRNGVPFIELNKDNRLSPSQLSGDPLNGVKEYLPMPSDWSEQFKPSKPSDFSLSMLPANQRREVMDNYKNELATYEQTAKDAWAGQKMDAARFNDTLTRWTVATPTQRQEMIAELDPRQKGIPASERRLDTRAMFEAGVISAQEGRLLERAFYGTDPTMPSMTEAFEDWKKTTPAGKEFTQKYNAIAPDKSAGLFSFLPLPGGISKLIGAVGEADALARKTAFEADAKQQFLTDFYKDNSRRVDFSDPAFVASRNDILKDVPLFEWANKGLFDIYNSTAGSAVGILGGAGALTGDWLYNKVTGGNLLSDQAKQLIGSQTMGALRNMSTAVSDRIEPFIKTGALLSPGTAISSLAMGALDPNAPKDLWTGKTAGQLNRAWDSYISDIDNGTLTQAKAKEHEAKIGKLTEQFSSLRAKASGWMESVGLEDGAGYRMSYENSFNDPRSAMAQFSAAYQQTRDPRLAAQARSSSFSSQSELEIQRAASDYATANGTINESTPFGGFASSIRGGFVAPLTEYAIEIATNLAGFASGGVLFGAKALGTASRVGSTLNKAAGAISTFEKLGDATADAFRNLGKIDRAPGTALTAGQRAWNTGVDMAKQAGVSGGGEFFEEAVAAFGEAGASFGDAINQGMSGFIGGVGMSAVHAVGGAGLSAVQQIRSEQAQTKALTKFVADYNKQNNTGTQLTLDVARQAQNYQSPQMVAMLNGQRKDLIIQLSDINNAIRATPNPRIVPGALAYTPDPKRVELLKEKARIENALASNILDTSAIGEQSVAAAREINALPPGQREVVDAALRAANGVPLSVDQETTLTNHTTASGKPAVNQFGDDIVLTDEFREEIKQVAPETAKAPVLRKTQAERDAELRAKYGGVFRVINGRPVFIADKKPASATTPVQPATPSTPAAPPLRIDTSNMVPPGQQQTAPANPTTPEPTAPTPTAPTPTTPTVPVQPTTPAPATPISQPAQNSASVQAPSTPKTTQQINDAVALAESVIQPWDRANRNRAVDEWFDGGMGNGDVNRAFDRAANNGGDQLATHGMAKVGTLTKGLRDLVGLLTNDIDPNRGGGRLYTAPLAVRSEQAGFAGGTASGTSYRDGPFILVQNQESSALGEGITSMDQVAAILVNEANIDQLDVIKAAIQAIRPDIIVAPYSQADTVASQLTQSSAAPAPAASSPAPTTPQVPAPIPVTPPVTQNFQTPDGAQVSGTFEKQPDGNWQQTSPEAPIFTVTPDNTQFFQTLEDKAAYALNPQAPSPVLPGEFGQEGYTAIDPAPQGEAPATPAPITPATAETTTEAAPPPLPEPDVFTQPVNRGTALLMLQTAAPWVSGAPIVVRSQRFFQSKQYQIVDAATYATLSKQERAKFSPMASPMFVHQGKVHIDETALVEYLANTAPEVRQERLKAALREELIHLATLDVRTTEQLTEDWNTLPAEAKRRVIETYYTEDLRLAKGDWTKVKVPAYQAAAEFWRMYLNSVTEGRTTEQVDIASEVASLAESDPSFAQRIKEALQDIARWLREELLGQLDPDTRADFEQVAAKIDAKLADIDAMLGITPQPATPASEAASPMAAAVPQANAPPASAATPAETIDTPAAPLTRLPEKAAPRNQAFIPKPARGAQKWTQEALNTSLTSAAGSFGYKIVDTGIPSQYTAYGETLNYGTALYDKLNPGNEIGKWIDAMNADTNPAGNAIIQAASEPGLHRVWYGHDFFTNVDNVAAEFGWSEVPSYIIQLLKDGLTRSGLPLPGVELLVQSGAVSDRVATDWLSTNIGEVFGGGLSFLGTYKLYRAAKSGRLSKPQVIFATVGIGLKLVSGVMTAQPFLILSGLADTAILVTNLDQVKAAFKKGIQEFNKKPQAVRDLFERVAPPTVVAPISNQQDGQEVKLPGSYPGDLGANPSPATTLPVQPVQSVEATPPPLPPEETTDVITTEPAPPPLPPEPVEQAAAPVERFLAEAKPMLDAFVKDFDNRKIGDKEAKQFIATLRATAERMGVPPGDTTFQSLLLNLAEPVSLPLTEKQKGLINEVQKRFAGRRMRIQPEDLHVLKRPVGPNGYSQSMFADSAGKSPLSWAQMIQLGAIRATPDGDGFFLEEASATGATAPAQQAPVAPTIKMAQAAKTLGVTPKELLRLVKAAVIPAEKTGNNYLFTQEALDTYTAERAAKQAPILEKLAAVAGNTASEADIADLRQRGLVEIYRGQRVINPKGYDLMAKAGIAPRLTRNQRVQEIDDQLGPVQVDDGSDIPLNPRVTRQGRLYIVQGPQGSLPAQIPITNERQAREQANAAAEQFDAREAELEALRQEQESQQPEPEPEAMDLEPSETDAPLVPKFYNLLVSALRDYNGLRERGDATPESADRLVTQALAIAQRLGMEDLHPGTLFLRLGRLPVGPLTRSQAALIDAVHDIMQDGTRDIAPADLNLKSGIASPAGFTSRDSSPLSWGQLIQLGALRANPRPDGSLRVRMGKTPEQIKADAEQSEVEAMQREYLDDLRSESGNLEKTMEDASATGFELLDAIQMAGGLPSPTSESAESHRGELTTLFESAKAMGKGAYGGKGIFVSNIFRKDAPGLDRLAQTLRGHGFATFTPSDVLDLIDERFSRNRPMYGTTTDFDDGMGERAVAAKPRVRLANASVTTEAGPIFLKKAHHGTPHKVDRFSLEKIGSGEGAQVYGWGLYFAEEKKVATGYRDALSGVKLLDAKGDVLVDLTSNPVTQKILKEAQSFWKNGETTLPSIISEITQKKRQAELWASSGSNVQSNTDFVSGSEEALRLLQGGSSAKIDGNLYTVELDVELEDLLDWDKPLSEQSEKIRNGLASAFGVSRDAIEYWTGRLVDDLSENGPSGYSENRLNRVINEAVESGGYGEEFGFQVWDEIKEAAPEVAEEFIDWVKKNSAGGIATTDTGESLYRLLASTKGSPKAASEAILAAGIPGIRYLDGDSRAEGQGTSNYVIFDENLIRIVAENGEPVGNAEVVKNLMADSAAAGMLEEDGIPGALPLDAAAGLAESGTQPGAQPAQGAAPTLAVDARQGELGIPAEASFAGISYRPARIWGLQALAERFLALRNRVGGQPIQAPIFRRDFGTRQAAFLEAAQTAESLYRDTLANVDATYADRPGTADYLLPRLPEVRALFTDANGEVQLLGSRPVELDAGEPLFAKPRRIAPHQLDLFSDNYNQTATPWTPSWQAKEPAKAEAEVDAPALSLEAQTESSGRIEDFGEKLEGARKDLWQRYTDMVMADLPADARDITLAKYLPEPDYEAMIASGMEPARVAAVKALRDVIPRKPSTGFKLAIWTKMVRDLRPLIQRLIDPANPIALDKFQLAIADSREISDTVRFYQDLGWPHFMQAKGWKLKQSQGYVRWNGEPVAKGTIVTYMEQDYRASTALSSVNPDGDWRQGYAAVLEKFRDYLDAEAAQAKEPKKIDFQIYSDTQTRDVFIGKKGASGVVRLQTGFASAKEARNWLTDHYNDLALKWEGMRGEPVLRRATNEPRTGPKRREGDVTPEMFSEAFGFRGVQFGNYVEGERRQRDLNNAFDAFMDLSEALGIPAKALSFDGSLGLAFGARGRGGKRPAAAHYEADEVVINLTKKSGPGSLAHEWFHSLDNYFARLERTGSTAPKALDEWATRAMAVPKNVRPEVMEAFRAIRNSLGGDLDKRSRALDSTRSAPYYSQTIEKAARAFETYVIDRLGKSSVSNDYLANIDPFSEAYPRPNEMDGGIRQAFDTLFTTLDTRQGERGTMLFAKPRRQLAEDSQPLFAKARPMRDTTAELFGDETPFNLVGETLPPTAPAQADTVVDAQAREQAFRQSGREDVGDLFGGTTQAERIYWTRKDTPRLAAWDRVPGQGNPETTSTGYISGKHSDKIAARAAERGDIGVLVTPLMPSYLAHAAKYPYMAVDNGVFSRVTPFNPEKFRQLVDRVAANPEAKERTLFVVAPDVVGDAAKTLAQFTEWARWIQSRGLPVALAAQNGLEYMQDQIPWDLVDVLFIGGSTEWKIGQFDTAKELSQWASLWMTAHDLGIPIHMGRVNTNDRISGIAQQIGVSTVDGTYLAFAPDKNLPKLEAMLDKLNVQGLDLAGQTFPELGRYPSTQELYDIAVDPETVYLDDLGGYAPAAAQINAIRLELGLPTLATDRAQLQLPLFAKMTRAANKAKTMPVAQVVDAYERTPDPQAVQMGLDVDLFPGKREVRAQIQFSDPADLDRALEMTDMEDAIDLPEWVNSAIEAAVPGFKSSGWAYLNAEDTTDTTAMISVGEDVPVPDNIVALFAKPSRDVTRRNAAVQQAAQDYFDRKISQEEYLATTRSEMPYIPMDEVPSPATAAEMEVISEDKKAKLFKASETLRAGDKVGLRLDIPAYRDHGVWIVSVHQPGTKSGAGTPIGYEPVARIRNATFESNPKAALNIARGTANKSTVARMEGEWVPSTPEEARQLAESAMNDPQWVQVGMNPFRHSWFYNRATGVPVVSAEDVVQVGGLVLAKNPVYTTPLDERFDAGGGVLFAKPRATPQQDAEYLDLAQDPEANREQLQEMVDAAERLEAESNFEREYGSKIFGEYPQASKVFKRLDGTLKNNIPLPVAMLQSSASGNKYYVRTLMVTDDNGVNYGFYNDRKGRTQVIRNSRENFGVWDDPAARNSYLAIAELIAKRAKYPAINAKLKDFAIDWWSTQGDIKPTAKLKDFIEWKFLDDEIGEVQVRRGTPTTGWNKAATKAGYQHLPVAKFKDGTEIIINTGDKELFRNPSDLFASLIHEAVHLIQAKEGRLYKSLQGDANYYSNDIEKEAKDAAATIPLLDWAENNLGDYIPGKSDINHPHSLPPAASAVITDDSGEIIPLSERFNPESDSILFAKARKPRPSSLLAETKGKVVAGTAVGTRNPTGKAAQEAGTDRTALVDLASMRRDPELFRKNAVLLANFPLVARQVPEAAKLVRTISAPLQQAREQFADASKRLEDARNELKAELARRQGVRPNKIKVAEVDKLESGESKVKRTDEVVKAALQKIKEARKIQDAFRDKRDKKLEEFNANSKALLAGDQFPIELADRVYAALKTAAKRNLELLIELFPADLRDTARLWYDGANIIAQDFATRYNTTLNRSAAVLAVFSPQKDWFMNVALGQRMMNIWANHQNTRFDDAMAKQYLMRAGEPEPQWDKKTDDYKRDAKGDLVYTKGAKPIRDEEGNITSWENWDNEKAQEKFEEAKLELAMMRGKKLSALEPRHQARFIRMWSEVYDAPSFPVVTPAGTFGNNKLSEKGNEQRLAWGSYVTIEKAIRILTAPAASEMQVISNELGVQHKVRSFYNNIVDPANADGHVTMDTHAIAAILWQALSGNSPEVSMNFGGGGASGNSNLGISGLYPAFAEAYREVAAEFGLLPREVQSITWESVRLLFPAKFKSQKANVAKVREVWDQHEQGTITTQQAHDRIFQIVDEWKRRSSLAGQPGRTASDAIADGSGVGDTDWAALARNGFDNSERSQAANDAGGLPDRGRRGDGTGRSAVGRRGAGRDAGLLPATPKGRQPGAVLGAKPRRTPPPLPPMEKRIEASLDAIESWNNVLRAAEEKPAGSVRKLATEIRETMPYELWKGYQEFFRGRLDYADTLAPGVKAILQAAQQEESLAQIGVNAVVDGLRRELQKAFGDPAFWSKNRKRLKEATRVLLPIASYLQPESVGVDGGFVWREFERRSGTISQVEARKLRLKDGQWFQYDGRTYRLGDFLPDEKAFVLLEPVSVEMQQAIYEEFWQNFPEALPILDRWITPDLKDAFVVGMGGQMSIEFNREALFNFMNDWPQDLKDAFGDLLPEVPRVEGYTPDVALRPDVAAQKAQASIIASILGKYKSPGRKFKSGALREAGNVKNLIDGFSIRSMEAQREKIRMRMREGIIEKAVVLRDDVPAENIGDYVALEDVFSSIVKAVEAARLLDKKAYPHLSRGLNPKDQVQLMKLVGDASRLNGIEQMVHKDIHRELMLSMARAQTDGIILRILNFFLRGTKLGVLTAGSGGMNFIGNEIQKYQQLLNRIFYSFTSLLVGETRGAKVNALEAMFLLRGLITDRMPNTANQSRIADLIPRELFDNTTQLSSLDAGANYGNLIDDMKRNGVLRGPAQGLINAFQQGGISAAELYAVHYGGGDAAAKQQSAYAAYRARAEVAADEAGIKKNRREWMRNWINRQVRENTAVHQEVMDATRLFFMDYSNVPSWMDPSASLPNEKARRFLKEHGLWFAKYPFNFMRLMKRMGVDGAIETFAPSSTKAERARGLANMLTLAAIAFGGAALLSGDDEEDSVTGSRYDEEGNFVDRDQDTSSRLNISAVARNLRLGRVIATALRMAGVSVNDDLTNHRGDDFWMYYRNITWLSESLLMGRVVRGDFKGFLNDAGPYLSDMMATGILMRILGNVTVGSFDAKKKPVNLHAETAWDVLSSPINPSGLTRYISYMVDPASRRMKDSKALDFTFGPLEAVKAKIPGLTKTLPAAGVVQLPALLTSNYNSGADYNARLKAINKNLSGAERDAAIRDLDTRFREQAASGPIDLRQVMFQMGIDPAKAQSPGQTTRNIASDLSRLQQMGVGAESVRITDKRLKDGRVNTYIAYPDPDTVAYRDPMFSLIKIATGVNIRPLPRRQSRPTPQPETLTPDFMFGGGEQQANLTLPRQ